MVLLHQGSITVCHKLSQVNLPIRFLPKEWSEFRLNRSFKPLLTIGASHSVTLLIDLAIAVLRVPFAFGCTLKFSLAIASRYMTVVGRP